jgi:MSHA biogenesis protein MshM
MYETHFGLREAPFTLTPNTDFFVGCASHQEALNTLMVATRTGEGFIKLVGEVGTGKTLLCRTFLNLLERENVVTAYIPNPYVGPNTLLLAIADELGIHYAERVNQHQLLKALTNFMVEMREQRRRVVVCLDEAQAMPVETLEVIRLLTNLETERSKLLQVVLFGQPELDRLLSQPRIRQLKQRITFSYRLRPMSRDEIDYYVSNRLRTAGYDGSSLFRSTAIGALYRASGGVPRLVNILANKALLAAYGQGAPVVTQAHVRLAIRDTESASSLGRMGGRLRRYVSVLFGVAVATFAWVAWK